MPARANLPLLGLGVFAALGIVVYFLKAHTGLIDFKPLYCAAAAQRLGLDPYLIGSLRACEATRTLFPPTFAADEIAPAPLPPYVLALLAPLSLVPYDLAAALWLALGAVAIARGALGLARLGDTSRTVAGLAVALGTALLFGRFAPPIAVMLWALAGAALALEAGRPRLAALLASVLLVQPHVGAAVLLALFLARRRARLTIAGIAAAVVALSLAHATLTLRYLGEVLPRAAIVHASDAANLGTSWILHGAGLPAEIAARAGSTALALALAAGILVARLAADRLERPSLVIALVPAFALGFGIYTHVQQAALVLPAAFTLARDRRARGLARAALLCLAVPWLDIGGGALFAPAILVVILGTARLTGLTKRQQILAYLGTVALLGVGALGPGFSGFLPGALERAGATAPGLDAEQNLAAMDALETASRPAVLWLLKLPTWLGYGATIAAALSVLRPVRSPAAPALTAPDAPAGP